MNDLVRISPTAMALTAVPPREVSYADIRRDTVTYPLITAVPHEVAVTAIQQMIWRATFNAAPGAFADADNAERIAAMASELYDLLLEDYNALGTGKVSFAELARVIRRASVTRDTYGINVRSLLAAVEDYCAGEGHKAALILQAERWGTPPALPPATAPTSEERTALADTLENFAKKHNMNGKI